MVEVTTQEYDYNISYIVCLQYFLYRYINMPPQAEGGGSTWSLNRKAVNGAVGNNLVKTYAWYGRRNEKQRHPKVCRKS
jgi:hypothetical protein